VDFAKKESDMMRLTLRTLLAYLDDMLEPADTKIIGQKIQESPMAQLLVSRIREVMRRRRLKAPDVFGPEMGIDPNIVSQYLDNTLAPEQYADVERVLLASDDMLAEAASCHEILTVDPPTVALAMRERLYALGPVDTDSQLIVPDGLPRTGSRRTPQSIPIRSGLTTTANGSSNSASDQHDRTTTVPDYLKRSPWFRRVLPSAIVGLLVIISAALLAPEFLVRVQQANNEIKRKGEREKVTDAGVPDKTESLDHVKADPVLIASDPNPPARTSATASAMLRKRRVELIRLPPKTSTRTLSFRVRDYRSRAKAGIVDRRWLMSFRLHLRRSNRNRPRHHLWMQSRFPFRLKLRTFRSVTDPVKERCFGSTQSVFNGLWYPIVQRFIPATSLRASSRLKV